MELLAELLAVRLTTILVTRIFAINQGIVPIGAGTPFGLLISAPIIGVASAVLTVPAPGKGG